MAFGAIAAISAGTAVTATAVLTTIATVGTALSVVGAVTGNKSLIKIGGAMGLIGGIGGLVAGAVVLPDQTGDGVEEVHHGDQPAVAGEHLPVDQGRRQPGDAPPHQPHPRLRR